MSALVGDQDRLLHQAVGIETVGGVEQGRDLLGEPRLDRLGLAARRGFRLPRQLLDLVDPLGQDLPERRALALAHLDEFGERLVEGLRRGGARGLVLLLVPSGSATSMTPLMAEQAVDARRDRIDLAGDDRGALRTA